jgi:hypothetical protein
MGVGDGGKPAAQTQAPADTTTAAAATETLNGGAADENDPLGIGGKEAPKEGEAPAETAEQKATREAAEQADKGEPVLIGAPPEGTAYELKAPEGLAIDADMAKVFEPTLRGLNLSNDGANKLLEGYGKDILPKVVDQVAATILAEQQKAATTAAQAEAAELNGSDLGGAKLVETRSLIATALDTYGTPELRAVINKAGIGANIHLARFLAKVGAEAREAPIVNGGVGAQELTPEQKFYSSEFQPRT